MTHLYITNFNQNPNVGLYSFANNKTCILGERISKKQIKKIKEVLQTDVIQTAIAGTSLAGVFMAGNDNNILVPSIMFESELKKVKKKFNIHQLETKHTALGNNIVANNKACLISPSLKKQKKEIKEYLQVDKIKTFSIRGINTIGSLMVLNDKGCLVSEMATDKEIEKISKFFNVEATPGTVNLGSPYVSSGLTVNNHGFILGDKTGGPESTYIDEALGFIEKQ